MPALFGADREHEFLRRLRVTKAMAYAERRQAAICAEKGAGLGLNFLGLIIIIALTDITGIFRGILIDGTRASIMVELYIDHRFL